MPDNNNIIPDDILGNEEPIQPLRVNFTNEAIRRALDDLIERIPTSNINLKEITSIEYLHNSNDENNKMVTLRESDEKIPIQEASYCQGVGWFKKGDPRLIPDFFNSENFLIKDKRFHQEYCVIFTSITDEGLLTDPKFTIDKNKCVFSLPNIYVTNNNIDSKSYKHLETYQVFTGAYVLNEMLNNPIFKEHFKESLKDGIFYNLKDINIVVKEKDFVKDPKHVYRKVNKNFSYLEVKSPNTYINTLGKKYTFGLEIETMSGFLPRRFDSILDYTAVHDGSLRQEDGNVYGAEYVTGVLSGDKGLAMTRILCNELTKRCLLDKKCGVHAHFGNVPFNKENIVFMYHVFQTLEEQILNMFPPSRRNNVYCRALTKIDINIDNLNKDYKYYIDYYYNEIIKVLSKKSKIDPKISKKFDHPQGHKCGYDHSAHRYCWVNFIPAVFNTRGNGIYTIEFRPHSATTSYKKIKNWLLICMAMLDIVENNKTFLLNNKKFNLFDIILLSYGNDRAIKLIEYIEKRTDKFKDKDVDHDHNETLDNEIEENLSLKNL